jgi:hypothetical protein
MAVSITTIQGSDNVGLSRLTINANFAALKAASDAVTALLDPTTASLSGVKSVQIDNAASALSSSIFSVSKGASILGNMTLGTIGASTSVSIRGTGGVSISEGSLSIGAGNLSMVSTSLLTGGNVSVVGEKRAPGLATAFTNTIGLTGNASVAVATKKYIILSNASPSATGLTATLQSGSADGQVVEIYHVLGASGGPVSINTSNFVGLTGGIQMTVTGDKLECIYDSGNWYLWDFTMGATSSIVITR